MSGRRLRGTRMPRGKQRKAAAWLLSIAMASMAAALPGVRMDVRLLPFLLPFSTPGQGGGQLGRHVQRGKFSAAAGCSRASPCVGVGPGPDTISPLLGGCIAFSERWASPRRSCNVQDTAIGRQRPRPPRPRPLVTRPTLAPHCPNSSKSSLQNPFVGRRGPTQYPRPSRKLFEGNDGG